jgi:formate hydrogenlyase subunit 6/NADH:ubiquinone oxidoreductase subunit I
MFKFLKLGVLKKGVQTRNYPEERSAPFDAFLGLPVIDMSACDRCSACISACPTQAMTLLPAEIEISTDRCIFCAACADACPEAITMGKRFELASRSKDGLKVVYTDG